MDITDTTAIIRPELHAPEVDEYDEVDLSLIQQDSPALGEKVIYSLHR